MTPAVGSGKRRLRLPRRSAMRSEGGADGGVVCQRQRAMDSAERVPVSRDEMPQRLRAVWRQNTDAQFVAAPTAILDDRGAAPNGLICARPFVADSAD